MIEPMSVEGVANKCREWISNMDTFPRCDLRTIEQVMHKSGLKLEDVIAENFRGVLCSLLEELGEPRPVLPACEPEWTLRRMA